ncbi:MAG: methyltransferase dimerization domain-containing protein, partial [Pirellula sp.]
MTESLSASVPSPALVLDLLESFRRSKTMFAAVELGIFDALEHGGKSVEDLATELQLHVRSTQTLLEACAALG